MFFECPVSDLCGSFKVLIEKRLHEQNQFKFCAVIDVKYILLLQTTLLIKLKLYCCCSCVSLWKLQVLLLSRCPLSTKMVGFIVNVHVDNHES